MVIPSVVTTDSIFVIQHCDFLPIILEPLADSFSLATNATVTVENHANYFSRDEHTYVFHEVPVTYVFW